MLLKNIETFFDGLRANSQTQHQDDGSNPAALPDHALDLLKKAVTTCGVQRVFEFGSGRSTHFFLQNGCHVTSIEDSQSWTQAIKDQIHADHATRLNLLWRPLQRVWLRGVPYQAWKLSPDLRAKLQQADLTLIDSPLYTGFRENVLFDVLRDSSAQIVVLDDLRIPSVREFCDRLAADNPSLVYLHSRVGHEMGFFYRADAKIPLRLPFKLSWWFRAWRRYLIWRLSWRQKHQHA